MEIKMLSVKDINLLQAQNEGLKKQNAELQKENAELKENFEGQRNAYKRLNSMYGENCEYTGKLEQTLQDIKAIATECMNKDTCYDCEYYDDCYIEDAEIPTYDICKLLIQKITKAEEE